MNSLNSVFLKIRTYIIAALSFVIDFLIVSSSSKLSFYNFPRIINFLILSRNSKLIYSINSDINFIITFRIIYSSIFVLYSFSKNSLISFINIIISLFFISLMIIINTSIFFIIRIIIIVAVVFIKYDLYNKINFFYIILVSLRVFFLFKYYSKSSFLNLYI